MTSSAITTETCYVDITDNNPERRANAFFSSNLIALKLKAIPSAWEQLIYLQESGFTEPQLIEIIVELAKQ